MALTPSTGEVGQAPAEQAAGEVLLGDAHLTVLPALAQLMQVGQHDLAQDRFHGVVGEQAVEHSLCCRLVHVVQGLREDTSRVGQAPRCSTVPLFTPGRGSGSSSSAARAASAADRPRAR